MFEQSHFFQLQPRRVYVDDNRYCYAVIRDLRIEKKKNNNNIINAGNTYYTDVVASCETRDVR